MGGNLFRAVLVALVAAWVLSASMFQVKETELAIKFRLREIVAADFEPGLHFMIPWIETVQKFDSRVLTRNYPAEPFLTSEGKILRIDFYVKWRISDVSKYYPATGGSEDNLIGNYSIEGLAKEQRNFWTLSIRDSGAALDASGIDRRRRPETLQLTELARLADYFASA